MDKRMPYSIYKRFFPQHKAEEYDAKKKSILVIDIPDKQDLFDNANDVERESRYHYFVTYGTNESWRMDNWRRVVLRITRVDCGNAHYWRTSGGDYWMLADAVEWARCEAKDILAHRQATRGCA
jgi:hypothetical protein